LKVSAFLIIPGQPESHKDSRGCAVQCAVPRQYLFESTSFTSLSEHRVLSALKSPGDFEHGHMHFT